MKRYFAWTSVALMLIGLLSLSSASLAVEGASAGKATSVREILRKELSDEEADKLEERLRSHSDNLSMRIQLLGYYFLKRFQSDSARKACQQHILWIIQHHPDTEIAWNSEARLDPILDMEAYSRAKELWLKQVEAHRKNTAILGNAASFFLIPDRDISEDLFKKAQALEPDNPKWPEHLGRLYALGLSHKTGNLRKEAAAKALKQLENARSLTVGKRRRFYGLAELAKVAFEAESMEKARSYATELLGLAPQYEAGWNYGNAIHHGNDFELFQSLFKRT